MIDRHAHAACKSRAAINRREKSPRYACENNEAFSPTPTRTTTARSSKINTNQTCSRFIDIQTNVVTLEFYGDNDDDNDVLLTPTNVQYT